MRCRLGSEIQAVSACVGRSIVLVNAVVINVRILSFITNFNSMTVGRTKDHSIDLFAFFVHFIGLL